MDPGRLRLTVTRMEDRLVELARELAEAQQEERELVGAIRAERKQVAALGQSIEQLGHRILQEHNDLQILNKQLASSPPCCPARPEKRDQRDWEQEWQETRASLIREAQDNH